MQPWSNLQFTAAQIRRDLVEKVLGQRRNVFDSFAQSRERKRNRADAEIQIVAKTLLSDELSDVLVRRSDQSHVNLTISNVSHAPETFLFQDLQQFGLDLKIDVAHFVEEDRAAMGHLEQSLLGSSRACERAFFVTEEFCFEQFPGQTGAVEIDKRFVSARTVFMEPTREHAFAGSGFTQNQAPDFQSKESFCAWSASARIAALVPMNGSMAWRTCRDLLASCL